MKQQTTEHRAEFRDKLKLNKLQCNKP